MSARTPTVSNDALPPRSHGRARRASRRNVASGRGGGLSAPSVAVPGDTSVRLQGSLHPRPDLHRGCNCRMLDLILLRKAASRARAMRPDDAQPHAGRHQPPHLHAGRCRPRHRPLHPHRQGSARPPPQLQAVQHPMHRRGSRPGAAGAAGVTLPGQRQRRRRCCASRRTQGVGGWRVAASRSAGGYLASSSRAGCV